jgi:hypothetical protein
MRFYLVFMICMSFKTKRLNMVIEVKHLFEQVLLNTINEIINLKQNQNKELLKIYNN